MFSHPSYSSTTVVTMKSFFGLFILAYFHQLGCLADGDDAIVLRNLEIRGNEDAVKLLQYPTHKKVRLNNAEIPYLTVEILGHLKSIKVLKIGYSILKTIHVLPQLETLHLDASRVSEVIINPVDSFDLEELIVIRGDLTKLPANITTLGKLRKLRLRSCKIEYVNADDLSGLQHLESIDLGHNRIASVSSSAVKLPQLELLDLSFNRLVEVNFKNWNAPKLREINLSVNKLTIAASILQSFPHLHDLLLSGNQWHCSWRDYIVNEAKARDVAIDSPPLCDEASVTALIDSQSKFDRLEMLIANLREELGKAYQEIERLQGLNSDLVEAFYRYTIEKV
ncbi:leucine-rich repeat-containing G-protein coupled receptor 4-like [Toxorhynchites rutilus septentrionalis]|uniref:leucine-rich repeat-containing G-protein coupled receptor 4-like n=1 Tax=Toxorhynchites rutilus septentrionalis TaxID=329112 RepID=UPI00247B204B|nr:leucine-rich repeat-containing G-protein coupled receptor 4-like [Toxorhynchites rutilus septentrionalis]XP_055619251.1 leucine-rich repeat-containing G-protein coupled receptor 4-like [Toxorhynchites rutilus septentrionalis]XP_055619257.1 leucine-rich repeat-containing G-protein coupled receptor 4-like [Toxorhynchites rutilus septentrionalis]XP_055619263.1 leucine-rich repeat-containing G-protein coupled receptor 4-like [Toxorhynchites rutilus septentrionalis]